MVNDQLRFYCERSIYDDSIKLHIGKGRPLTAIAQPIVFAAAEPGMCAEVPAMTLPFDAAQDLVNALWDAGFRPAQGKQSEGVTAAQGRHLEDMRTLAFAKLNVERP